MKKKILYTIGGIFLILFLMIFRPVWVPSDEKDLLIKEGTVVHIFEGGTKDATFRLKEYPDNIFYFNRALENGLKLETLKNDLMNKKVTMKYPSHWTPLDPFGMMIHSSILEHEGEIIYSELK